MAKYSIFLTVGTQLPFDRLVRACEHALSLSLADFDVIYQVGLGGYKPNSGLVHETLPRDIYANYLRDCDIFITHAGIGGIASGISAAKYMIVMPRLTRFGEHRNDHQSATAASLQGVPVVSSSEEILLAIRSYTTKTLKIAAPDSVNFKFGEVLMKHIQGLV